MSHTTRLFPSYGVPNIAKLREQNMAYVDKTSFIRKLEETRGLYVFMVRPRRFGKTMFSSILCAYYDEAMQDQFEEIFARTEILERPTLKKGSYRVLQFDFSGIDVANPKIGFISKICNGLTDFYARYPIPEVLDLAKNPPEDPSSLIDSFFRIVRVHSKTPLYVIVDEYDEMLNEILSGNSSKFQTIIGDGGFVKAFYASLKSATSNVVDRIFITGVLPISLDSMTSGFNIAKDYTLRNDFADALGFTESELSNLIAETVDLNSLGLTQEYILKRMKSQYNGYRFAGRKSGAVFNPSMCLYYLEELINSGREPYVLFDPNVDTGGAKLMRILEMANPEQIDAIADAVFQDKPVHMVQGNLGEPINLERRTRLTDSEIIAVMFYMGFLTRSADTEGAFVCPNQATKANFAKIFFNRQGLPFSPNWSVVRQCLGRLAAGDVSPLLKYVADQFAEDAGLHFYANLSEKVFQTALYIYAKLSPDFMPFIEFEANGFLDVLLIPTDDSRSQYAYVFELKYLSQQEAKKPNATANKIREANLQLVNYCQSRNLTLLSDKPYRFIVGVYQGLKLTVWKDCTEEVLGGNFRRS